MYIILWLLRIGLCVKFFTVGYSHAFKRDGEEMAAATVYMGRSSRTVLWIAAVVCFVFGIGLVIPVEMWVVPVSALVLAFILYHINLFSYKV